MSNEIENTDKPKPVDSKRSNLIAVIVLLFGAALFVFVLILIVDYSQEKRAEEQVKAYVSKDSGELVSPYQDLLDFKSDVQSMGADVMHIKFLSKIDEVLSDGVLTNKEYEYIKSSYYKIKDDASRSQLLFLINQNSNKE